MSLCLLASCGGGGGGSSSSSGDTSGGTDYVSYPALADDGGPLGFCDNSQIPAACHVMIIKILNRTNAQYSDDQVYWRFNGQI